MQLLSSLRSLFGGCWWGVYLSLRPLSVAIYPMELAFSVLQRKNLPIIDSYLAQLPVVFGPVCLRFGVRLLNVLCLLGIGFLAFIILLLMLCLIWSSCFIFCAFGGAGIIGLSEMSFFFMLIQEYRIILLVCEVFFSGNSIFYNIRISYLPRICYSGIRQFP